MAGQEQMKTKSEPRFSVNERMQVLADAGLLNARNADLHWLYENSVQNVDVEVDFMNRVFQREFGRKPVSLREDFCGTALLCSAWANDHAANVALGVDFDGPTLEWGRVNNIAPLGERASAVTLIQDDVRNVLKPRTDIIAATNFSWWGFKTRRELGDYFRLVQGNLKDEGMLMLDCYGGPEAQIPQIEEKEVNGFNYFWDQDVFNPIKSEIKCMIHFEFPDGSRMENAFKYDWRLWTLAETSDLLKECGYRKVVVYWEGTDEDGEPNGEFEPSSTGDSAPAWVAYLLAFK